MDTMLLPQSCNNPTNNYENTLMVFLPDTATRGVSRIFVRGCSKSYFPIFHNF